MHQLWERSISAVRMPRDFESLYTNNWDNLQPGRCRYGFMLGEDGMVMDDGVTTRIASDHYLMTTTTGGAAAVMSWMERDGCRPSGSELKVCLTSVTDHWSVMSVAGPNVGPSLRQPGVIGIWTPRRFLL